MKKQIIIFLSIIMLFGCYTGTSDYVLIKTEPRYSPDGKKIIFTISEYKHKLYIVQYDLSEKEEKIIYIDDDNCFFPAYSPDYKYLVFSKSIYKSRIPFRKLFYDEICIMNLETKEVKQLTMTDQYNHYPIFSPDSKKIYFARKPEKISGYEIYCINIDGTDERKISKNRYFARMYNPSVSKDNKYLIFSDKMIKPINYNLNNIEMPDMEILRLDIETGELKSLIDNINLLAGKVARNEKIIYGILNYDKEKITNDEMGVYEMDIDGNNRKQIFYYESVWDNWQMYMDISPDDDKILYVNKSHDLIESNIDGTDMHKIELSGIRIRELIKGLKKKN